MAILSRARAISSSASTFRAHPRSNRFISNHLHRLSHDLLACPFGSHSIDQNISCRWQKTTLILCTRMSNSRQRYPRQLLSALPVSLSSTSYIDGTPRNLCLPVQQWCCPMVFASLLMRARIKTCFDICSASKSTMKTTPESVAFRRLNLHTVSASPTT